MVEVVQNPTAGVIAESSPTDFFHYIINNIGYLILAIILIGLTIGIIYIIRRWEEERQERDDPIYQNYKNIIRGCISQADISRIKKTWSPVNLFWFGLPFIKNEHSNKVVDYSNNLIGFYRGHMYSQDGCLNFLVYRTKFLFFEQKFIVKCPYNLKISVVDPKTKKKIKKTLNFNDYIIEVQNKDYKILCSNLEKLSYWWYPVYIAKNKEIVDLRNHMNEGLVEISNSELISRVLSLGGKQVEKAMLHNPELKFKQMEPQKTKHEEEGV